MQIQINTDTNINGDTAMAAEVTDVVASALHRFRERITRIEVHLGDESSDKKAGQNDMRCMLEARLEGRKPIAVTHQAASIEQAVAGATHKLTKVIESSLGKLHDHREWHH